MNSCEYERIKNLDRCSAEGCKCNKGGQKEYISFESVFVPAALGGHTDGTKPAENGAWVNKVVKWEADGAVAIYGSDGIPVIVTEGK